MCNLFVNGQKRLKNIEFVRLEGDLVNNQLLILVNKWFGNKSIEKFEYY